MCSARQQVVMTSQQVVWRHRCERGQKYRQRDLWKSVFFEVEGLRHVWDGGRWQRCRHTTVLMIHSKDHSKVGWSVKQGIDLLQDQNWQWMRWGALKCGTCMAPVVPLFKVWHLIVAPKYSQLWQSLKVTQYIYWSLVIPISMTLFKGVFSESRDIYS